MKKNIQTDKQEKTSKSTKAIGSTKPKPAAERKNTAAKRPKNVIVPTSLNIRSYQVGFGDCFLMSFSYPETAKIEGGMRHILVDFGSTGLPPETPKNQMMMIAEDIRKKCGGKLHIVVATHRHKDHISGFTTQADGSGTGDIISKLNPDVVIQPWTEDPDIHDPVSNEAGIKSPEKKATDQTAAHSGTDESKLLSAGHLTSLTDMNIVSATILSELAHLSSSKFKQPLGTRLTEQIRFLADDNELPNKSAVENLRTMGERNYYVSHGAKMDLAELLPGIDISVLGPPTLAQHDEIRKQRSADKDEFWMFRAAAQRFWGQQAATTALAEKSRTRAQKKDPLFPEANKISKIVPPHNRWFVRQIRALRGEQMLGLVRILDKAMNNTSVILLFDIAGKKLLFPGDAQIENWEYALSLEDDVKKLKDVEVYKVGHHGSRNATPKTLWEGFERKSEKSGDQNRLKTVVSTMEGKHGSSTNHSEVPRQTLVEALRASSEYHTTQEAARNEDLFEDLTITF